jgi:hypothetical protein
MGHTQTAIPAVADHLPKSQRDKKTTSPLEALEIFAKDTALGFVELGKLVEDFEGGGVKAAGTLAVAAHLVDDGKVSKAQADFGMVRTEELFADPKGLHVALLGTEEVAALAKDSSEVGCYKGCFAVHGAMAMGCLVESASEKNGGFFQLAGEFAQHREIVQAHRHATLIAGKFV